MYGDRVITLLTNVTASAAPTVSDAFPGTQGTALPFNPCDQAVVCVQSTAGSGVMTAIVRLWGYQPELARWFDLGPLAGGSTINEVSTADIISYAQGMAGLRAFSRLYAEITGALGGAATAITVSAVCTRAETVTTS